MSIGISLTLSLALLLIVVWISHFTVAMPDKFGLPTEEEWVFPPGRNEKIPHYK